LTPSVLRALLEGDRSARGVVAHVTSVEPLALQARIAGILAAPGSAVANVDEDQALEDSELRAGDLLDRFEVGREESLALIDRLSDEELAVRGELELVGAMTVEHRVTHFAFDDAVHIQQIVPMLALPAELGRGGLRQF
jgi:hypothetical protein